MKARTKALQMAGILAVTLSIHCLSLAATYEATVAALTPIVDASARAPGRDEQITAIIKQWDGYTDANALRTLLLDLAGEKYRHQAQAWMFRLHAAEPSVKGDMLARLVQQAPSDDQRRRLLFLADPRYFNESKLLRWVMAQNLDDRGVIWDDETRARWPIRNRLQSMLEHYLNQQNLVTDADDLHGLSAYMDPAYEDDMITRTKQLIASHPEHFAAPDPSQSNDLRTNVPSETKQQTQSIPQSPTLRKASKAKPAAPMPSEEPASSTPWAIFVVMIATALGLVWLLLKRRS